MSEKQDKKPESMSIFELMDELTECAILQQHLINTQLLFNASAESIEARVTYLQRRIEACRDEIVRRVGN